VANAEDEHPDFDELGALPDDPFAAGPVAQPDLVQQAAAAAAPEEKAPEEEPRKGMKRWLRKKKDKDVERVGREEKDEEEKADAEQPARDRVLAVLAKADPYTVMLAVALLAVLIAIFCLWMELPAVTAPLVQAVPRVVF
jgi:hypothetical protein